VLQAYVVPAVAVKVAVAPAQIVGELTVGKTAGLIVTVATAVDVHVNEVPVTVYEVVAAGVTFIGLATAPVLHEYVVAPAPVNVAVAPGQIVGELTVVTGSGLTVIVNIEDAPTQVPIVGIIVIVDVIGDAVEFVAVNAGKLTVPLTANPIAAFELVQVKVAPAGILANVFAGTAAPAQ
jgi:hypothetical protein